MKWWERGVSHVPEGRQVFPFSDRAGKSIARARTLRARGGKHEAIFGKEQLTLFPRLAERMEQLAGTLSGGETADGRPIARGIDGQAQAPASRRAFSWLGPEDRG